MLVFYLQQQVIGTKSCLFYTHQLLEADKRSIVKEKALFCLVMELLSVHPCEQLWTVLFGLIWSLVKRYNLDNLPLRSWKDQIFMLHGCKDWKFQCLFAKVWKKYHTCVSRVRTKFGLQNIIQIPNFSWTEFILVWYVSFERFWLFESFAAPQALKFTSTSTRDDFLRDRG